MAVREPLRIIISIDVDLDVSEYCSSKSSGSHYRLVDVVLGVVEDVGA